MKRTCWSMVATALWSTLPPPPPPPHSPEILRPKSSKSSEVVGTLESVVDPGPNEIGPPPVLHSRQLNSASSLSSISSCAFLLSLLLPPTVSPPYRPIHWRMCPQLFNQHLYPKSKCDKLYSGWIVSCKKFTNTAISKVLSSLRTTSTKTTMTTSKEKRLKQLVC